MTGRRLAGSLRPGGALCAGLRGRLSCRRLPGVSPESHQLSCMRSTRLPHPDPRCACWCFASAWPPAGPWFQSWQATAPQSANFLSVLLGDSRRMFANHFFVKADAYFHSGFYPTVLTTTRPSKPRTWPRTPARLTGKNKGDETGFLGKPRDWIDAFSRHFFPTAHTHLDEGGRASGDLGGSARGAAKSCRG